MKKKICRVLTLLLSFSIALCMVVGMASAQGSEKSTVKITIGNKHSIATLADDVYSTCPNVSISVEITSSVDQEYKFSSSDGAEIEAVRTKKVTNTTRVGNIESKSYTYTYSIYMWAEGTHTITAKGETSGSETFTLVVEHTPVDDPAVAPTCTETGLTEGSHCSSCGKVFEAQEVIPALGHTYVIDEGVDPTCTEPGLTEGSHCSVCGAVTVEQEVIPALGHTWDEGEIISEPTCSEKGEMFYTCTVCGETKTDPIDTLPHTWSEPTWDWSEDYSEASATWTCEVCGTPETLDAEVTSETTATCTEAGETTYTATVTLDDVEYTDEKTAETEALGHDWGDVEWTWSDDHSSATASWTCKNCGLTETLDATVTSETVEATETKDGSITYTATVTLEDGTELSTTDIEVIPATGEDAEDPDEDEDSKKDETQDENDESETESAVPTTYSSDTGSGSSGSGYSTGNNGSGSGSGSSATSPQTDDPTSFSAWWIIALGISFCLAGCGALVMYRFRKVSVKN